MPEPTSTTAATATIVAAAASVPLVTTVPTMAPQIIIQGIAIGLRADVLLAGFAGAIAALAFFNAVPSSGDTARELVATTFRRMAWALASAVSAGYLTPLLLLIEGERLTIPAELLAGVAFVVGAGAQQILAGFVRWAARRTGGGRAPGGGQGGGHAAE